jgi:hypothetical protein
MACPQLGNQRSTQEQRKQEVVLSLEHILAPHRSEFELSSVHSPSLSSFQSIEWLQTDSEFH